MSKLSLRLSIAASLAAILCVCMALNAVAALAIFRRYGHLSPLGAPAIASILLLYFTLGAGVSFILGIFVLNRSIARPVDSLTAAAERIGRLDLDQPLESPNHSLGQLGSAFAHMAQNLKDERERSHAHIAQLENLNRQLAEAHHSLARSDKLATVGRLAAGVAHEIGNPLGAILGYLELAKSKSSENALQYLERIDHEVGRIDRTVRELLDFSRPGPDLPTLDSVNLAQSVDRAVSLSSVQKRLKQVDFQINVPADFHVLADHHRLSQVLVNILLNAGDAMKGQGLIEISAQCTSSPGGRRAGDPPAGPRIEITVADQGPGIPLADLPRIFDPFFTTKDPGEGTGLGLSISQSIIEAFGGEIHAANRPSGGAVFTLVLREAPSK